MGKRLRKILPWIVAICLMAYMFYKIPIDELAKALSQANVFYLLATVFFVDFGCWLADSWATSRVATWYLVPVKFSEMLPVRAATYLMAILNYNLGQAGLIYFLHKVKGAPILKATALIMMMMGSVILLLAIMSLGGLLLVDDERTRKFGMVVASLAGGAVVYFILLSLRPNFLARRGLFKLLFEVGISGHLKTTLVRVPHMAVIIAAHVFGMRCFDIQIPLGAGMIYIPLVLLVASLPLTPFGLGTMQATAVYFFSPFAGAATPQGRQALVFGYSMALSAMALMLQGLMGLAFFKRVAAMGIFDRDDKDSDGGDDDEGGSDAGS